MQVVEIGRTLQKKETGLIHIDERIPLLENALFAYALFRTRLSDNVLEGKAIIEKILAFEVKGNFPCFLHEYPNLLDPYLGLRILPIFFFISTDFSHVIGPLKETLEMSIQRIIEGVKSLILSPWAEFRLLALHGEIGSIPQSVYEWGLALISLQIAEKKGADIKALVNHATSLWSKEIGLYIGASFQRHQDGPYPKTTLFDLFMCQWQKMRIERVERPHPILLYKSLIHPLKFEPTFYEKPVPYVDFDPECETPLFIAWKKHTFVLAKCQLHIFGDANKIEMRLPKTLPESDFFEVNFFLNDHEDHELSVNGRKSTTFKMDDHVEILSKDYKVQLFFETEGGKFFGHILKGNRPSQHACRGKDLFTAFDWRIAIRTVSRKPSAIIRAQILLSEQKQGSQQLPPLHASHYPHTTLSQ